MDLPNSKTFLCNYHESATSQFSSYCCVVTWWEYSIYVILLYALWWDESVWFVPESNFLEFYRKYEYKAKLTTFGGSAIQAKFYAWSSFINISKSRIQLKDTYHSVAICYLSRLWTIKTIYVLRRIRQNWLNDIVTWSLKYSVSHKIYVGFNLIWLIVVSI